jgi:hypothetical protein
MKWHGQDPFIIGVTDEHGNISEEIVIQPGEEFSERALVLLREAGQTGFLSVPREGAYDRKDVEAAALREAAKGNA